MAFTDPLVLVDNSAANQNFTRKQGVSNLGSDWVEDDSTAASERFFIIRHSNAGASTIPGAGPRQRHLIGFGFKKYNSLVSKTDTFGVNLTVNDDPASSITLAERRHFFAFLRSFAIDATMDKILRGEA